MWLASGRRSVSKFKADDILVYNQCLFFLHSSRGHSTDRLLHNIQNQITASRLVKQEKHRNLHQDLLWDYRCDHIKQAVNNNVFHLLSLLVIVHCLHICSHEPITITLILAGDLYFAASIHIVPWMRQTYEWLWKLFSNCDFPEHMGTP